MLLPPQMLLPAHCYHAVHSAHKSLWIPPDMAQVMTCRSLKRSHSSHSLSSYSAAESQLLLPSRLDHQFPSHFKDATVQTTPPCDVSHQVSTQTSDQQDTLSCDVAVQTSFYGAHTLSLDAAAQTTSPSTLSQHVSTQMGSRSAFLFYVDTFVQTPIRSVVQHDAATQLPLTEFFIGCNYSNSPLDRQYPVRLSPPPMQGSHALPQPPPGLEQPVPPPELAAYSHLLTNVNSSSSHAQQSPVSTTQVGTHPVRTASSAKRSAGTAPAGTHNPTGPNLRTDTGLFPKPRAVVLPMVSLGNPSPTDLAPLPQLTAISCTINSDFPSFSGIQAQRAEILPTSSLPPVVGFMQLSFRKPATMSRTSLINSECTPTTWTLLSCSTRTPLSQTPQFSRSRPTPRAKVRGAWYYSSFEPCCAARLFLAHLQSHFARYIHNVVAKKRDASTELLQFLHAKMLEHNVDFMGW